MSTVLPEICHRTRQHVSLRLDTELSELEEALAAAHLRRCATCQAFAVDLEEITEVLRAAPLEEPSVRFQLPHRPARFGVARVGTVAAAAITAAIAVSGFAGLHSSPSQISASDLQSAHDRLIVKERLIEEIDGTTARQVKDVPRGVEAAKNANL
jgi:hypothetical protein